MNIIYILVALAAGAGMSTQAAVNTRLSAGLGEQPLLAAFISFAVGAICLGVVAWFTTDWQQINTHWAQQPIWRWLGGCIGAGIVFSATILAQKLGVANTMFIFILGQLLTSMLIDHFALIEMKARPIQWWQFIGMGVMLVGLVLFIFGDRWFQDK